MLVVSDITDVIMPSPEDLLVNLQDSRDVVDALLESLPTMFQVMPPLLSAAYSLLAFLPSACRNLLVPVRL